MAVMQSRKNHRGKRHRQNSPRGGLSEHEIAGDLVIHSQDLGIFPTKGSQLRPGQVPSGVNICLKLHMIKSPLSVME